MPTRPLDDAQLLEIVDARLLRGFERAKLPLLLSAELDVDPERVERALVICQERRRALDRRKLRRGLVGGLAAAAGFAALAWLARGSAVAATALLIAAVATGGGLLAWMWSKLVDQGVRGDGG